MNLFYLLDVMEQQERLCNALIPIATIIGYVIFVIKIVVPIILIVVGMLDLAKAILEKEESKIKAAQQSLIKKVIIAVCVFLVISIVGLIMSLISPSWEDNCETAIKCALTDPFGDGCSLDPEGRNNN